MEKCFPKWHHRVKPIIIIIFVAMQFSYYVSVCYCMHLRVSSPIFGFSGGTQSWIFQQKNKTKSDETKHKRGKIKREKNQVWWTGKSSGKPLTDICRSQTEMISHILVNKTKMLRKKKISSNAVHFGFPLLQSAATQSRSSILPTYTNRSSGGPISNSKTKRSTRHII